MELRTHKFIPVDIVHDLVDITEDYSDKNSDKEYESVRLNDETVGKALRNKSNTNEEDICIGGKDFFEPIKAEVTKEQLDRLKELQYKTGGTDVNPKNVNHPKHYNNYSIEVIDMMEKIYGKEKLMVFCELNAFKYRMRMGTKGSMQEDFEKEQWYLNKIKELTNEA